MGAHLERYYRDVEGDYLVVRDREAIQSGIILRVYDESIANLVVSTLNKADAARKKAEKQG